MRASEDQLKAWMVGGLDGDAQAHGALLKALVPLLRTFYRRRLEDGDAIEDLVQETLIDHVRRARQTCPIEGLEDILIEEGFESASSARMDVTRLLATLPAKQAQAIRHMHIDGHSVAEAAQAAGIGESDVKVSVHRGLKALAARIIGDQR